MNNLNLGTEDQKYLKNYKTKQNKTKQDLTDLYNLCL